MDRWIDGIFMNKIYGINLIWTPYDITLFKE